MKIQKIDHVHCRTDDPETVGKYLYTTKKIYRKSLFGAKEKRTVRVPLVDKNGLFLTGFLKRVERICSTRNIPLEIEGYLERLPEYGIPKYEHITLYDDQKELVLEALQQQRGVIKAPTGTGKTVVTYAIIQAFMSFNKPCKALIVCPSTSITTQTAKTLKEKFQMNVSTITAGKANLSGDVVVGIINSIANLDPKSHGILFDIIIIDETHHVNMEGMYEKLLAKSLAPVRIGLTATPDPANSEKGLACEGLLGPIIGEFTMRDAIELGRIAKPRLELMPVPINGNIRDLRTWHEIYNVGIVFNRMRNKIITKKVKQFTDEGKSCIVFAKLLEHAETLVNLIEEAGVACHYVAGNVTEKKRDIIKAKLDTKQIKCVVATAAWREGVDVPNLDAVINAAGYLSEKAVLQMAGRCLRAAEGKEEGVIVDFIDSGKYLSEHCVRRLLTYAEKGWL